MERATKAADTYDEAKLKESLELSNAEMLIDCLGGGDLQTDLYDYIVKRCEENSDKTAQTSNGKYWIDTDGKFYYTDNDTNRTVELGKDTNGAPMIIGTGSSSGGETEEKTAYQIRYNANGGDGQMENSSHESGTTKALNANNFTKPGCSFEGWATTENGEKEYDNQEEITNLSTTNGETVNLYAVWKAKKGTGTEVVNAKSDYGTKVNYSANGINDWKVFLNDGTNVYIIASDYVLTSGFHCAEDTVITGDYTVAANTISGLINWLTNNLYWSEYARGYIGATAIGGPTLEQFLASYNGKYGTTYSAENEDLSSHIGYSDELYFSQKEIVNNAYGYWLTSSSSIYSDRVQNVYCAGLVGNGDQDYYAQYAVRPLIKLPANTVMSWKGDAWDLVEKATERITPENYGDKIQYSANGVDDWKVFLNDGKNVYLIASDWITGTSLNAGTNIGINGNYVYVTDSNPNTLVNWMKNTEYWQKFVGVEGATVTGGPTKEQYELSVEQSGGVKDVHLSNTYWIATTHPTDSLGAWGCFGR